MTCHYRCNNACDAPVPNESDNARMRGLVEGALARRSLLKGGAAGAGALVLAGLGTASPAAAASNDLSAEEEPTPLPTSADGLQAGRAEPVDAVTIPAGYAQNVVIRWGDPIRGAPAFDFDNQTAEAQAGQFGYNNDFVACCPCRARPQAMWSPTTSTPTRTSMFPAAAPTTTRRAGKIAWPPTACPSSSSRRHRTGSWVMPTTGEPRYNRRITATTRSSVTGPAAGSEAAARPPPTRPAPRSSARSNNCAGGTTPWGTILSGEENFNQYFASGPATRPTRP